MADVSAYAGLRRELAFWGIDTEHLSDAELEERVAAFARAGNEARVSTAEAAAAIQRDLALLP